MKNTWYIEGSRCYWISVEMASRGVIPYNGYKFIEVTFKDASSCLYTVWYDSSYEQGLDKLGVFLSLEEAKDFVDGGSGRNSLTNTI